MARDIAIVTARGCPVPEINRLITAYCFGRASEDQCKLVAAHLLECRVCWQEVRNLETAVSVLKTDSGVMQTVSPADFASALGSSAKFDLPLGGHLWHAIMSGTLFGLLYTVALLVEVAYEFDRYKRGVLVIAPLLFGWMLLVSLGAMWVDWRWTSYGRRSGLWMALLIELVGIALLYGTIFFFLPATPITKLTIQAYTAQAAYLKTIVYFIFLQSLFALLPFHFVLTMQRELQQGRHRNSLSFLNGDRMSIAPRGVLPIRFWVLSLLLAVIMSVSLFLHHNLMIHLLNVPGMNLFASLIWLRLLLYYAAGVECLIWLYRGLNELKRECLAVLR